MLALTLLTVALPTIAAAQAYTVQVGNQLTSFALPSWATTPSQAYTVAPTYPSQSPVVPSSPMSVSTYVTSTSSMSAAPVIPTTSRITTSTSCESSFCLALRYYRKLILTCVTKPPLKLYTPPPQT